jgi:hypothetical protein
MESALAAWLKPHFPRPGDPTRSEHALADVGLHVVLVEPPVEPVPEPLRANTAREPHGGVGAR